MPSWVLVVLSLALAAPSWAANPFEPALIVNTGVITHYDIDQRIRLLDAMGANGDLRNMAVQQLTEDRVKVQAGDELGVELPEGSIDAGLEEFATTRGLTVDDVQQALVARDIDRQTIDDFIESGLVWREVISARFRARATPSDADLDSALELARTTPREVLDMAEIALPFAERGEEETIAFADELYREISRGNIGFAEAAREYSRSATAERGGTMDPIPAAQLPPALRTQVLLLRPGQVTRPVPISGGLALLKVTAIRQVRPDPNAPPPDAEQREALRQQLFSERINSFGQGYLQELLGDALITER